MGNPELFAPEFCLLLGALLVFACTAIGVSQRTTWLLSMVAALATVVTCAYYLSAEGEPFFPGIYKVDAFSQVFKLGISIALALGIAISGQQASTRPHARVDMHFFLYMSTFGMMMLVSATELLTLYIGLELSAYGLYILAALHRNERMGGEAAAKYMLFGAAASAVSLYGISMIYGATQTTYIAEIMLATPSAFMIAGVVLTLLGLLFKLAAFPVHAWAPDVYQGAPNESAVFLASASKVAAVGVLLRVLAMAVPEVEHLSLILVIFCVASMTLGNLAALVQTDFKRLLGFSAVAHAGYILIGLLTFTKLGAAAAIFYVLTYVPIVFCAFLVVAAVSNNGENPSIKDLAGLYKRSPFLALILLAAMFGLAGIPPTPGLAGKWFLFSAAIDAGYLWLVIVAALNATVSLYYYLLVVKEAYLSPPDARPMIKLSPAYKVAGLVGLGLIFFTGFYPAPVWTLAEGAAQAIGL
jgi:NADH-quinone oxidoreductase subunit N